MKRLCSIDGCGKFVVGRGYCNKHYKRWQTHGDANIVLSNHPGPTIRWIENNKFHVGEACLIWPFSVTKGGYPIPVYYNGKRTSATRVMCELVNGPPPTDTHEAAHSCGKGHLSCIHPKHLRWATPKENSNERRIHGTMPLGESHPGAKLNFSKAEDIRRMYNNGGISTGKIAKLYGVSQATISHVVLGKVWVTN